MEGLFRSQKGFNDTFAMISLNRFFDSKIASLKYFTRKSLRRTPQKSKKCDFSQMNILLPPMIICGNTHLGAFAPLPKRFYRIGHTSAPPPSHYSQKKLDPHPLKTLTLEQENWTPSSTRGASNLTITVKNITSPPPLNAGLEHRFFKCL